MRRRAKGVCAWLKCNEDAAKILVFINNWEKQDDFTFYDFRHAYTDEKSSNNELLVHIRSLVTRGLLSVRKTKCSRCGVVVSVYSFGARGREEVHEVIKARETAQV